MAVRSKKASTSPPLRTDVPPGLPSERGVLGPQAAVPLFGRSRDQTLLRQQLAVTPVVVVKGPAGVGKSRLVAEVARELAVTTAAVRCLPGDTAEALVARVERALRCGWGNAQTAIASSASLVILDQAHELTTETLTQTVRELAPNATSLGRLIVTNRDGLGGAVTGQVNELDLAGLDAASASELFDALDARFGPVAVEFADADLWSATRGNPAAIAQHFGAARVPRNEDATLCHNILSAVQVFRLPVPATAIAAMLATTSGATDAVAVFRAVDELVAQQKLLRNDKDLLALPVVVAGSDAPLPVDVTLQRAAAALWHGASNDGNQRTLAAGGNLHGYAPIDAAREAMVHAKATGDDALYEAMVAHAGTLRFQRGAVAELMAYITESAAMQDLMLATALQARRIHDVRLMLQRARRRGDENSSVAGLAAAVAIGNFNDAKRLIMTSAATAATRETANALRRMIGWDVACEPDDAEGLGLQAWHREGATAARVHFAAARSALSAPLTQDAVGFARLSAHYAACLLQEGRVSEAVAAAAELDAWVVGVEAVEVFDWARLTRANVLQTIGDYRSAAAQLRGLMQAQRIRGDEVAALATELSLAELEVARGHAVSASELATVVKSAAQRLGCVAWAMRADLVMANVDLLELRADEALGRLEQVVPATVGVRVAALVEVAMAKAYGFLGRHTDALELSARLAQHPHLDQIERQMVGAEVAVALGDLGGARELLHAASAMAERHGRRAEMIAAFALLARVELARGDRAAARSVATRAAREAMSADLAQARCMALLALGALARSEDDAASGVAYARDAAELASGAGLPIERFVAYAALDAIAGPEAVADPASPSAATLSPMAFDLCTKILAELGLTSQRPFGLIDAQGATSEVVDASPEVLQLAKRALAIDGVRESIWRHGQELADLRRRSLLKKLLFMFASAPGKVFSKEAIVSAVWNVEYHPLRHDAALFTNIMRIRRLLGEGGAEIIRVTDDGYRFVPPSDFVFVFAR